MDGRAIHYLVRIVPDPFDLDQTLLFVPDYVTFFYLPDHLTYLIYGLNCWAPPLILNFLACHMTGRLLLYSVSGRIGFDYGYITLTGFRLFYFLVQNLPSFPFTWYSGILGPSRCGLFDGGVQ